MAEANRVFCAMGSAQILFLASGAREDAAANPAQFSDHLVMYGMHLTRGRKEAMEKVARSAWRWNSIQWVDDILDYETLRRGLDFAALTPRIRERIGTAEISQLWVCRLGGGPEQIMMASFPQAEIVFCEDGIGSYVEEPRFPGTLLRPRRLVRNCRNAVLRKLGRLQVVRRSRFYRWPVRPLSRACLLLARTVTVPRHLAGAAIHVIHPETMRAVIDDVVRATGIGNHVVSGVTGSRGHVLVLGQVYHRLGRLAWEEERDIYLRVCSQLDERGFGIIWKEHPKNHKPFFDDLRRNVPSIQRLSGTDTELFPIECFVGGLGLEACVSATSTALFTLNAIFGIPAFTFATMMKGKFSGPLADAGEMTAQYLPSFNELCSAGESA